jgi:RNA polymerase subunit RPABC4/transcription elongation factor Spt4
MLNSHIAEFSYFCPLCGGSTFSEHWMPEYSREWNKCPSCSYMELKTVTKNRVINKLDASKLDQPFVEPIVAKLPIDVSVSKCPKCDKKVKN